MNLERFTKIVNAYGAQPANWPVDERQNALDFSANSEAANLLLQSEQSLDALLNDYTLPDINLNQLKSSIITLNKQPDDLLDRFLNWILPRNQVSLWRPVFAATLPLLVGTLIGLNFEEATLDTSDQWDDEIAVMFYVDSGDMTDE